MARKNPSDTDPSLALSDWEKGQVAEAIGGRDWHGATFKPLGHNWYYVRKGGPPVNGRRTWWVRYASYIEVHEKKPALDG